MNNTMAFENDTSRYAEAVSLYWGYIVGIGGALITVWGVWRKYIKKRVDAVRLWVKAAAILPLTLQGIQNELHYENGITLRQVVASIVDDLDSVKKWLALQTAHRRSSLQMIATPVMEFDKDGKLLWANDALLHIGGHRLEQLLENNWRNFVAMPDREDVIDGWHLAVQDGTDFQTRFRMITGDTEKWMVFDAVCNKDELGNVLGFFGKLRSTKDPRTGTANN